MKKQRRKSFPAQGLNEYGIIGLILVLLAVPALALLGGNLEALFKGDISGSLNGSYGNSVSSGGGTDNTIDGNSFIDQVISIIPKPPTNYQSTYNPTTRTYTYTRPNSKTDTVDADAATQAVAAELAKLVDMKDADGKPLPDHIKRAILRLANRGVSLAGEQSRQLQMEGGIKPGKGVRNLIKKGRDFQQAYSQLARLLKSDKFSQVKKAVDSYSGIISKVNSDYVSPSKPGAVKIVGTPPSDAAAAG